MTLTGCFFAVIKADAYEKTLKKLQEAQLRENIALARQIPYMRDWMFNETKDFLYLKKIRRFNIRNHVISREGDLADKIFIVVKGEVEIVKTNLN